MCVIVTAEKGSMPTIDQLTRMSETNPDGAGIAWHDGNGLHRVRHSDNGKTLAFITEHWNELWNDGYEAAINDMLNDGIDTTTGIRRRR